MILTSAAFTVRQAKELIRRFDLLMRQTDAALQDWDSSRLSIRMAADDLLTRTALKLLREVPVEELNREKRGIRTNLLRSSGYETAADIVTASLGQLAAINGIGSKSAAAIKSAANEYLEQLRPRTRLRISADDPACIDLLRAIGRERVIRGFAPKLRELYERHISDVSRNLDMLSAVTGIFSRFFSAPETKLRAREAYERLSYLLCCADCNDVIRLLQQYSSARYPSDEEVLWDFVRNAISYVAILQEVCPGILEMDDKRYGLAGELAAKVLAQPVNLDGMNCILRHFQLIGVKYILSQERVLLGDEMGLGKTVQAIGAMVALRNMGETHFLVVCPVSLIANWCREISTKSDLKIIRIHGPGREAALDQWLREGGVAVTGYETTAHIVIPPEVKLGLVTVDEAHYIKNFSSRRSINTRRLCGSSPRILFMTGTAIENCVAEMVALIRVLNPDAAAEVDGLSFLAAAPRFRELIAPVYFRRRREDVLIELPELIESSEWCTLQPGERLVYELAVLERRFNDARRVSWNAPDLRRSSKAVRMLQLIDAAASDGRKIIVFSNFLGTLDRVRELLGARCMPAITGAVPVERRQEILDEFNSAPAGTVLPAQILSGGTGLNIQAASVVILCEPQLKPSIELQAVSRAYRMGQARNVLVYRLLSENTADERISELLQGKQQIFDEFADVSSSGSEMLAIDEKTLAGIMEEERQRIESARSASPAETGADDPDLPSEEEISELLSRLEDFKK